MTPGVAKSALPVSAVERHIRSWLDEFVVGLNLCPFARPLLDAANLRIAICEDSDPEALRRAFLLELDYCKAAPSVKLPPPCWPFPMH